MKVVVKENVTTSLEKYVSAKHNLLMNAPIPEVLDADGNAFTAKTGRIEQVVADKKLCSGQHVQLQGKLPITVTYSLTSPEKISFLAVGTYSADVDYGYGSYEVYLSENRAELYRAENRIGGMDRQKGLLNAADQCTQLFQLEKPVSAVYFGIKFIRGSKLDSVVRLDYAAAFEENCRIPKSLLKTLGADLMKSGKCRVQNGQMTLDLGAAYPVKSVLLKNSHEPVYYTDETGTERPLPPDVLEPVNAEGQTFVIAKMNRKVRAVRSSQRNLWGIYCEETALSVTVDPEQVINPDFLGTGTNLLPTVLMQESVAAGYDPAFFEWERQAIETVRPMIARVWFQNDWFQTAPDTYDFNLPKMKAFMQYMQPFRELGTELEMNFSFTVGSALHGWYCMEDVPDKGRSAPKDLKQFARSVVACLNYLCGQGLNVKYITVSNEPENRNFAVAGDMEQKIFYYAEMLREIDAALKAANLRDRFEIWAAEDSSHHGPEHWLSEMQRLAGDVIDRYTKHIYNSTNNEILQENFPAYAQATKGGHICMTEFGVRLPDFVKSNIGSFIAAANAGGDTCLQWALSNAFLPDPMNGEYSEEICLWRNYQLQNKALQIEKICWEYGSVIRLVPPHSRCIAALCDMPLDARAAAFEKDGEWTVVVETSNSGYRDLKLDFSALARRPVYRMQVQLDLEQRPTSLLPKQTAIMMSNGCFTEHLTPHHSVYIYSTQKI